MSSPKTKVVIIGGGFGGLNASKVLGANSHVEVVVLDRRNHHLFQPLLYQVAMAGLSPADIAMPIRSVLSSYPRTSVYMTEVRSIDLKNKQVLSDMGSFAYDYCITACGAQHSYFGKEEWEPFAPGLKTIEQATEIRRRVFMAFEKAETLTNKEEQKSYLTFVVVGGGPTGVELAGAIGEISKYTLSKDFRRIDPSRTRIVLIEAGPQILPSFAPNLASKAARALEVLGVQIWTSSAVTLITQDGVKVGEEFLKAKTVLWAAGVRPAEINSRIDSPKDPRGRMEVLEDLSLPGYPEVFCVGDQAYFKNPETQQILPGLAPVAIQQGCHAAKNILRDLQGKERRPFIYFDKGQLATIGRRRAIMQVRSIKSFGFFSWMVWMFVHIYYLVGFRNRFFVFWEWTWHYMTYSRGARLIIQKTWQSFSKKAEETPLPETTSKPA